MQTALPERGTTKFDLFNHEIRTRKRVIYTSLSAGRPRFVTGPTEIIRIRVLTELAVKKNIYAAKFFFFALNL